MNDEQYFKDMAINQRLAGLSMVILLLAAGAVLTVFGLAQGAL